MATINIQIVRTDLDGLGVEVDPTYRPLKFKDSELIGYWASPETETMTVYIKNTEFICRWTKKNVELFDKILDGK